MFDARQHCGGGDGRLHVGPDDCDYVETDPAGRYGRFDDVLGKGAMKTVYRAFDELQGIEVAWNQAKICDVLRSPEALERLYSEVHLLSTLNHDSIIQFHASWVDAGKRTFNFITELFTSGTLREYRQRYRRVDIRAVKNWARQILHGLVYLHCHDPPVIHRDLKCDNIFVNGHLGQVKIGDLGLAAVLKGSQPAHSVIGTPEFMAPELYDEEYNELVDIYSFGMCVLEMITAEYPYSECSNPAQIYKKVTSGRLPDAFYRVRDPEAQRFIGRCLENVSNRSSAEDLLLDPFLQTEDVDPLPLSTAGFCKTLTEGLVYLQYPTAAQNKAVSTDMKITGKMNPDDDTIYLRVQIADKDGHVRNIYFPFDIISDTAIGVADEMVKELEITDRDPSQIAEVIDREITALAPHWKEEGSAGDCQHHVYSYAEEDGSGHHPFYSLPSPTSSQTSSFSRTHSQVAANCPPNHDWLQDMYPDDDDETISQISMCSSKYSYVNYNSCGDPDGVPIVSPRRQEALQPSSQSQKSTRFCPDESTRACAPALASKFQKQCSTSPEPQPSSSCCTGKKSSQQSSSKLARNRSMVDVRSQLLHQSLVEEVNRRMFKTIGSMENIGFQYPCEIPGKGKKPSPGGRKKLGFTWGRS